MAVGYYKFTYSFVEHEISCFCRHHLRPSRSDFVHAISLALECVEVSTYPPEHAQIEQTKQAEVLGAHAELRVSVLNLSGVTVAV